jgi:hypothetical protein
MGAPCGRCPEYAVLVTGLPQDVAQRFPEGSERSQRIEEVQRCDAIRAEERHDQCVATASAVGMADKEAVTPATTRAC